MRVELDELLFGITGRLQRLRPWLESGQYKKAMEEVLDIQYRLHLLEDAIRAQKR